MYPCATPPFTQICVSIWIDGDKARTTTKVREMKLAVLLFVAGLFICTASAMSTAANMKRILVTGGNKGIGRGESVDESVKRGDVLHVLPVSSFK
jgi:hypothetical protein